MLRGVGRLHVLIGATPQARFGREELARLAIAGGADTIQFRDKHASNREQIRIACALVEICRRAGVALIVNDRIDVALAADAAGVHLGQEDFPIGLARRLLGPGRIIGASAATAGEAEEAMWAGADYIGCGAIYATASKADAGAPIGPGALREISGRLEIPVIAIGGIGPAQVPEVMAAGAHGVAVIQAVALAADPQAATASLRAAIDAAAGPAEPGRARGGRRDG